MASNNRVNVTPVTGSGFHIQKKTSNVARENRSISSIGGHREAKTESAEEGEGTKEKRYTNKRYRDDNHDEDDNDGLSSHEVVKRSLLRQGIAMETE